MPPKYVHLSGGFYLGAFVRGLFLGGQGATGTKSGFHGINQEYVYPNGNKSLKYIMAILKRELLLTQ